VKIDVTEQVDTGPVDDECMPLYRCVCGHKFEPWTMILSISEDSATECPYCHRKFVFSLSVKVYQVVE
jgi:DNA-directed RNA polymerase subunit RPC12/RpoP